MNHRKTTPTYAGLVLIGLVATGCATAPGTTRPGTPSDAAGPTADAMLTVHEAERTAIATRPPLPDERSMRSDVELYTYEYRGARERRDTIQGASRAADWLRQVGRRAAEGRRPFELTTREVGICADGLAVERGVFLAPGADPRQPREAVTRSYVALWRAGRGGWRVERIWLAPAPPPSVTSLAQGCVFPSVRPPRLAFGLAGGVISAPGLQDLAAGMREDNLASVTVPTDPVASYRAWILLRLGGHAGLRLNYAWSRATRMSGVSETELTTRHVDIDVGASTATLLGEVGWGPVWVGAGPAVALVDMHYGHRYWGYEAGEQSRHRREAQRLLGVAGELSVRYPLPYALRATASFTYSRFPEVVPETDAVPGPFTLGRKTLLLGLEWAPE